MTLNESVSDNEDLSSFAIDTTVYRELIQQLYDSSIQRYGMNSEQTQMLKLQLTAHSARD